LGERVVLGKAEGRKEKNQQHNKAEIDGVLSDGKISRRVRHLVNRRILKTEYLTFQKTKTLKN
jgi:hypothetical protein